MPKYTFDNFKHVGQLAYEHDYDLIVPFLKNLPGYDDSNESRCGTFEWNVCKFENFLDESSAEPEWSVFTVGNSKLPFLSFSAMPGKNHCPGAGECLDFCYSFHAWRNPGAFFRQLQNSILIQSRFDIIEKELDKQLARRKFRGQEKIEFRLYVDGDFRDYRVLRDWMNLLRNRPQINCYGYSKSLHLFERAEMESFEIPSNYVLNLSSGGKHEDMFDFMKTMDYVRGEFVAIPTGKQSSGFKRTKEEYLTLRKLAKNAGLGKVFVCPGQCGDCVKIKGKPEHACGNLDIFRNTAIVIPVH